MDCSMSGFPVLHYLLEFAQTHVHWVSDTMQPSHLLSPLLPLPSTFSSIRVFKNELFMEFWKRVMLTLYAKQKKRHRCIEQTLGLRGRRRGWDVLREQHWHKYTIKGETDLQPRLDAWDKCSGLVHWEDPEGWGGEGDRRGDRDGEHM